MSKYLILIIIPVFMGCLLDNDPVSPEIGGTGSEYFPLQTDNSWTYYATYNSEYRIVYRVFGSLIRAEKEYFLFGTDTIYSDTLRVDKHGRVWKYLNGREAIWLDVTKRHNTEYTYRNGEETVFIYNVSVQKDIRIETVSDTFENCMSFSFDVPLVADEEIVYVLAPGQGIVRLFGAWIHYTLYESDLN